MKELIRLGSLHQQSYNAYINEYCQKINLRSHDGKVYKILDPESIGLSSRFPLLASGSEYEKMIKTCAEEYYHDHMAKINTLIEN